MHLETELVTFFCLLGSALALPVTVNQASNSATTGAGNEIDDVFARIIAVNRGAKIPLQNTDIPLITRRNAVTCSDGRCLWPRSSDGRVLVPYVLSSDFDVNAAALFTSVMQDFAALTCVNFVPRKKETDYLNIISGSGCYSTIGRNGGMQTLSLAVYGCLVGGIIEHELMHNLGFDHEHSRKDRDSYISIMWQYINSGDRPNFEIQSKGNLLGLPYDYNSVMHYGSTAYSNTSGQDTIIPKPVKDVNIGQRVGFSGLDVAKINKLYNCTFCTYLFTDPSGHFNFTAQTALSPSPGSCLWYIRAKKQVVLWINDYNIVSSPNCQSNYLRVYDGDSKSANIILDKTCGQGAGLSLLTSGVTMLVEFVYNNPRASNSFNAAYNTDNCGGTYTRTSGTVTSPNYPFASPPSTYCTWTISAPQGYKIALNMLTLSFPLQLNCQTDSLSVYDDAKPGSGFVGSYCTQLPGIITSYGTRLSLRFMGHSNKANIGFLVTYSFVPFPLVLTSLTGSISSPSYPSPYANNAPSLWLIQLPANNKVYLWFDAMNIWASTGCTTDYIKVYDGSSQTARVLMNKSCGKTLPQPVTASSNQILVEFVANSFVTGNGFQASYGNGNSLL
ncbi:astacin-like metalloendopeptidase [Ambystoma mexicanum]|uniref:astacin-like metalloendopeptidase n=1 Tax=Ambystoma mexicanum TaxID=8296 RepID=UPI0037E98059